MRSLVAPSRRRTRSRSPGRRSPPGRGSPRWWCPHERHGPADVLEPRRRPGDEDAFPHPGRPRVLVARAASYDRDLDRTVETALRDLGATVAGRSILLKPNLVEYDPDTVIKTDPRLVAATVLALRRLGAAPVLVAEGPGPRRGPGHGAAGG